MIRILIFICLIIVAYSASFLEEAEVKFKIFKLNNNRNYKNEAEETQRFMIFKENLLSNAQHNALYDQGLVLYRKGINRFSDMTQEEFGDLLTLSASNKLNFNVTRHQKTGLAIPDSVDWRKEGQVTEVKDQGACGSCWAFSIAGSTEAAYFRKSGKLISLSTQQLVDCTTDINHGCSRGSLDDTFPYVEQNGLESDQSYPYTGTDGACKYSSADIITKVSSYVSIEEEDEDALLDAVANIGPVSVGVDATFLAQYESGILDGSSCTDWINHAVLIVGYGIENGTNFWIAKNSWGVNFGEKGYFRLLRGSNICGVAEDAVYPIIN